MRPSPESHQPRTGPLYAWLDRARAGDESTWDEMLGPVAAPLEQLARGMLHRFPAVGRWEQTGGALNKALVRLVGIPCEVRLESMRQFDGLAAEKIRRGSVFRT